MKITIAAIGKMKASSAEAALFFEYSKRLSWKIIVKECKDEGALLSAVASCQRIIALDENGVNLSSRELASQFDNWQQQGNSHIGIIIGGACGFSADTRSKADLLLAFGRATWPHLMVRAMLAEQIYRVFTILSLHPYHRE